MALAGMAGPASGNSTQYCAQIPIVGGIPPWGFHTGSPITGATGSFARGHGEINLSANTVSNHITSILAKLHLENRIQAAVQAVRSGIS